MSAVTAQRESISTRSAYGKALARVGETRPDIVVLDADLSKSTMTVNFAKKFPNRFFQMGISESNMVGTAAGFAACGKKPFVSTFAIFCSRAWEQIRNTVARGNLPVAFCLTHAGLTVGEDGASAQANEDIAVMRAIPGMRVIVPADGPETERVIEHLAERMEAPTYVRLSRNNVPVIHDASYRFTLGKADVLREGTDLFYIACGQMVVKALEAAQALSDRGFSAGVINMSTVKPIDRAAVVKAAKAKMGIIAIEEHSVIGGLGEAVAGVAAEHAPCRVLKIGVEDCFGESGKPEELLEKYGLGVAAIVEKSLRFLTA